MGCIVRCDILQRPGRFQGSASIIDRRAMLDADGQEKVDGLFQKGGDFAKARGRDAVTSTLVFLDLLKGNAEIVAKGRLAHTHGLARQPDARPDNMIALIGTAGARARHRRFHSRYWSLGHRSRSPRSCGDARPDDSDL